MSASVNDDRITKQRIDDMKAHYLQHVPFEGPAGILQWFDVRGHEIAGTRLDEGEGLPSHDGHDLLIVMGGPMSVHDEDEHPWLAEEKRHIRAAIDAGKKVLGICLGAQLIADALGAEVRPAEHKEIGWFEVERTDESDQCPVFYKLPRRFMAFHWHGERFALPDGARHLATSEACDAQAFSYNDRVFALQFHVESTPESVQRLVDHCGGELEAGGTYVQTAQQMTGDAARFSALTPRITTILDSLDIL